MKATVELIYDGDREPRRISVPCKGKGRTLLNSIERAVEKAAGDDAEWQRWNLIEVEDDT
jgi:hypothetical protein